MDWFTEQKMRAIGYLQAKAFEQYNQVNSR